MFHTVRKEWKQRPAPITFEQVTHLAQEVLLRDGRHVPTLIVDSPKNPIVIQMERLAPTYEARLQQMLITGQALAHEGTAGKLRGVYFVTEAWLSQARDGTLPGMRPSRDPQRKEVLIVSGLSGLIGQRRQVHLAIFEMLRDEQGVLRELRDYTFPDDPELVADTPLLEAFLTGFWAQGGLR
ncbi:MAG TPA: hypothetical protein PKD55_10255 [Bellilinea sp.]|nr:hypothetical protein [Bellilinea sp.]